MVDDSFVDLQRTKLDRSEGRFNFFAFLRGRITRLGAARCPVGRESAARNIAAVARHYDGLNGTADV